MATRPISPAELNRLIGMGLRETGLVRASDVLASKHLVKGRKLGGLYQALVRGRGVPKLGGHENWYTYLEAVHGIKRPDELTTHFKAAISGTKLKDEELYAAIRRGIEKTGQSAAAHWRGNKQVVAGHTLASLFSQASSRKANGEGFKGHRQWHVFLEKELGISPLDHQPWSDGRFHNAIALLARKCPLPKHAWGTEQKPVFQGRNLQTFYAIAQRSNRPRKEKNHWFGHPSFKAYIEWAVKNYPNSEQTWKKWIAEAQTQTGSGGKMI